MGSWFKWVYHSLFSMTQEMEMLPNLLLLLLIIVFSILISEIMKKYFNLSVVSGLIFILIFIHILGFQRRKQ